MMWSTIKSFATVAAFTLLIWFAADLNVSESQTFTVTVRLAGRGADDFAAFVNPPGPRRFQIIVYGRRIHREKFGALVRDRVFEAVLSSRSESAEPQTLRAIDILMSVKAIESSQLTIRAVNPPTVSVVSDAFVTVSDVMIEPDYGSLQVRLSKPLSTVSVRLPRSAAVEHLADRVIRPDASGIIRVQADGGLGAGSFVARLRLAIVPDPGVTYEITPREVTLEGVVETLTDTRRFGPIPIKFVIPPSVQADYVVVTKEDAEFRRWVQVVGPTSQLDQLDARDIRGFLDIKAEYRDEPGKLFYGDVFFVLPRELPGLELTADSQDPRIEFSLRPRNGTGGDP